jgi:hypothetical protein
MRSYDGGGAAAYNLGTRMPTHVGSELHAIGGPSLDDLRVSNWYHPESPLFWVGVIAAVTFGLAAVSTSGSIKLGPLHASASAGAGK